MNWTQKTMNEKFNFNVSFSKMGFFRKLCWLYRFLKKMYGSLKKCTDCTDFFKKNCTDCFSKIVRIVRIFVRMGSKKFWPPWAYQSQATVGSFSSLLSFHLSLANKIMHNLAINHLSLCYFSGMVIGQLNFYPIKYSLSYPTINAVLYVANLDF